MKRKSLLLLMGVVISSLCWGQPREKDMYSFSLNGHKISPSPNFEQSINAFRGRTPKGGEKQDDYVILQFYTIPSVEEKEQLERRGLKLLDYLHGNAYFSSVSPDFYRIKTRESGNVRSITSIKPGYKIESQITSGDIPEYAQSEAGLIKAIVTYFDLPGELDMNRDLGASKAVKIRISEVFRQIYIEIPQEGIEKLATHNWVQNIQLVDPPVETNNRVARTVHRAHLLNSNIRGLGYGLTGKGVKIGLWDDDVYRHADFGNRVIIREYESPYSSHGTHTCGTIIGAGVLNPEARGMAPEASVYAWNFNYQSNGLTMAEERAICLEEDGIEITSNSYGYSLMVCPNYFYYRAGERNEDILSHLYPYFLYVFSAGNSQTICYDGYHTTTKNTKNSLHVAAIDNEENMSWFSSFGPSFDGRLIPNISGDGTSVLSTTFYNKYGTMSGTSMSCPGVAGTMALLYQRYKETHQGERPLSSLMRAMACNTAKDYGNPGPDYQFGYGLIDGLRAVEVLEKNTYLTGKVQHGGTITKKITVPEGAVGLRVMLAWTDPAAFPGDTKILINDLDLKVLNGDAPILPWVLDPENPAAIAVRGIDDLNNMEQVTINAPEAGTYTIQVDGASVPTGIQEFSIVYDVVMPDLKLTYPLNGEKFVPGTEEVIRWESEGNTSPFTLEYSTDGGINYTVIGTDIPASKRSFMWKVPEGENIETARFRISSGAAMDEMNGKFLIMSVPENVKIEQHLCNSYGPFSMTWDSLPGARYEVLKYNGHEFIPIALTEENHYELSELEYGNNNYFCVRATDKATGITGKRSIAATVDLTMPINSLPVVEKFTDGKFTSLYVPENNNYGYVRIAYSSKERDYFLTMQGASRPDSKNWYKKSKDGDECFIKNAKFINTVRACHIDASAYKGKKMFLKFDILLEHSSYYRRNTCYFRVKANDNCIPNSEGVQILGDVSIEDYKTVYYDLSAYAGESFSLDLESVCKLYKYYMGDYIKIDNLEIVQSQGLDLSVESVSVSNCKTSNDTVFAAILNQSEIDLSNIPISYRINDGAWVYDTVPGPVAPMKHLVFPFSTKADFHEEAAYDIKVRVSDPNDINPENNERTTTVYHDEAVRIGTRMGRRVDTCAGLFTDMGGQFQDYPLDETDMAFMTLAPDQPNKAIRINFTEFAMKEGADVLDVRDGPKHNSPKIAELTGYEIPPSFTSTSPNGELSFRFRRTNSYSTIEEKGWIAQIECVSKPVTEIILSEIVKPVQEESIKTDEEKISFLVRNAGLDTVKTFEGYFGIDESLPVKETFNTQLLPGETAEYSFDSLVDLSGDRIYKIIVGIDTEGDVTSENNVDTVEVKSVTEVIDMGIYSFIPVMPARERLSKVTMAVTNPGNVHVSDYVVGYRLNGVLQDTINVSEVLEPGKDKEITFEKEVDFRELDSEYNIEVFVKLDGDNNPDNDVQSSAVSTYSPATKNMAANYQENNVAAIADKSVTLDLINNYTVECWVYTEPNARIGYIFQKGFHVSLHMANFMKTVVLHVTKDNRKRYVCIAQDELDWNKWHHIALTVSSDNEYKIYINGVQQVLKVYGEPGPAKSNKRYPFIIGNRFHGNRPFIGKLDEFRVWDSCLDQQTLTDNVMTDYPAETPGMIAYYKFKEGKGKYVYDYSVNDNTAQIKNADVSGIGEGKFWNSPNMVLKNYGIEGEKIPSTFDKQTNTFNCIMDNANLSSLVSSFETEQNSIVKIGTVVQESGVTANNYANGLLEYTVEGVGFNAGLSNTFRVTAANDLSSACDLSQVTIERKDNKYFPFTGFCLHKNGDNFTRKFHGPSQLMTNLKGRYKASDKATVLIDGEKQAIPPVTARDYTKPFMVNVMAENQRDFKNYKVFIDTRSNRAELLKFVFPELPYTAYYFSTKEKKVTVWVNKAVDIARLRPVFKVSENAKVYIGSIQRYSGMSVEDFTTPKVYTIVSEDETKTAEWTVSVLPDSEIPFLSLLGGKVITVCKGSLFNDPGVIAKDNVDGDISSLVVKNGNINTSIPGSYQLEYSVADASGNVAKPVVRTVNVVESTSGINGVSEAQARVYSFDGVVYVDIAESQGVGKLTLTNVLGKVIYYKEDFGQGTTRLEADFMPGVYVAVLEANGKVSSENIVIE